MDPEQLLYGEGILPLFLRPSTSSSSPTALSEACVQVEQAVVVSPTVHQEQLAAICGGEAVQYTETTTVEGSTVVSLSHPLLSSSSTNTTATGAPSTREAAARRELESLLDNDNHRLCVALTRHACLSLTTASAPLPWTVRCLLESVCWRDDDDHVDSTATKLQTKRWIVLLQVVLPILLDYFDDRRNDTNKNENDNTSGRWVEALQEPLYALCDALDRGVILNGETSVRTTLTHALETAAAVANEEDSTMMMMIIVHCRIGHSGGRLVPVRIETSSSSSSSSSTVLAVSHVQPTHVQQLQQTPLTVCGRDDLELLSFRVDDDGTSFGQSSVTAYYTTTVAAESRILPPMVGGSMASLPLSLDRIQVVPDIVHKGYSIAHGTGWCGRPVLAAAMVGREAVPNVVRVRIGAGTTGLLLCPDDDDDWDPQSIGIRPSMVQYPTHCCSRSSNDTSLELVLDVLPLAPWQQAADRRQLLLLLEQLVGTEPLLQWQAATLARAVARNDSTMLPEEDSIHYMEHHVVRGRKANGQAWTAAELSSMAAQQQQQQHDHWGMQTVARVRVGIPDLYNVLDEGEIYLPPPADATNSNGHDVLLCRTTCCRLGGLQTVRAIPESRAGLYAEWDDVTRSNVVILSTQGHRPLADILVGLDMTVNEYFVITEPKFVDLAKGACVEPLPSTGYYNTDISATTLDSMAWFALKESIQPPEEAKSGQLYQLQRTVERSNTISRIAQAWFAVADHCGAGHDEAVRVTHLLQRAFDHSPTSSATLSSTTVEDIQQEVDHLLSKYGLPHWLPGGTRQSSSIIGKLHDQWKHWADQLEQSTVQAERQENSSVTAAANATVTRASLLTDSSYPKDMDVLNRLRASNALELLIDVVFGRVSPGGACADGSPVDYRQLRTPELAKLVDLVTLEFKTDLEKEVFHSRNRQGHPHGRLRAFDVYMNPKAKGGELLVCLRRRDGGLFFRTKSGITFNATSVGDRRRVASLTRVMRVLDSFATNPAPDSLMHQAMQRSGLVPVVTPNPTMKYNGLSMEQAKIVATVNSSHFKKGFLVVDGPPGSGKTQTIVEVIKAVGSGVILVGPTNASVANLARIVTKEGFVMAEDLVVWGENCDESVQFLNPHHRREKFLAFQTEYKALQDTTEKEARLQGFVSWLRLGNQEDLTIEDVSALCQQRISTAITGAKFLFCTINTLGAAQLRQFGSSSFSMLIMDDAGQCPEADFYSATTFPNLQRMLVVGDPNQMRAVVNSAVCQQGGLGKSFLGNCAEHHPELVHRLRTQYRMDSRILQFANESLYGEQIKTAELVSKRRGATKPLRFVDMSGMSEERRSGTSWKNEYDAAVIKTILVDDEEIHSILEQNSDARVIVISPYDAQVQLLRKQLKQLKTIGDVDIGTVDNFQGQEGDIVVVSLARTSSVQFSDKHRLNTAFTRAKLCLVVIGDLDYYRSASVRGSAIGNFATFVDRHSEIVERASGDEAWYRPNWEVIRGGLWEATFTSRFHECLKSLSWVDRNVALNTLLAVAAKSLSKLSPNPVDPDHLGWQRSSLRGYRRSLQIVWIAKSSETKGTHLSVAASAPNRVGYIDAHFAGSPSHCMQFIQNSRKMPPNACKVNRELTFVVREDGGEVKPDAKFDVSWSVTNELQHAILDDIVEKLPTGQFVLDSEQEQIVSRPLPLLVESRSGTGKTNCLFCHALSHARAVRSEMGATKPICFVTVSQRLCEELTKRYDEAENMRLQYETCDGQDGDKTQVTTDETRLIDFFSFRRFLGRLVKAFGVEMTPEEACSFPKFLSQRRSHQRLDVELHLAENEIGGAIMGSLDSARHCRPLTREEYLAEIRSNIKRSEEGLSQRRKIYSIFEEYTQFKSENDYYDEGDIVLKLVECVRDRKGGDVFQSLYLDEVQDFSFAAIYLMCHIAGKSTGSWCAAGDIAQMITPGCAFTFDGMKQTLRAVDESITLHKVASLLKNYRTSRGVLEVANAILAKLKAHYPEAIDHVEKETAVKDLNLPVVLLEWAKVKTYDGRLKLGVNQAVVYTGPRDSDDASRALTDWIGHHPFILSSLDSKGLEFDDVIVYTKESPRKAWELDRQECLALLRELYVAVTRAKERVVIVVAKGQKKFFESLDCPNIECADPSTVLVEFDKETKVDEWYKRGKGFFAEKKYELAAGCFKSAGNYGWLSKARGFHLKETGKTNEARASLRTAAAAFFDSSEYKECLDTFSALAKMKPWNPDDNEMLDRAMEKEPYYLPRRSTLEFAVNRGRWNMVTVNDLCDPETSDIFRNMRGEKAQPEQMKALEDVIRSLPDTDITLVGDSLPLIVGDILLQQGKFMDAIKMFVFAGDLDSAITASDKVLRWQDTASTVELVSFWTRNNEAKSRLSGKNTRLTRLIRLFQSPAEAAKKDKRAFRDFGAELVKRAVYDNGSGAELLHDFSRQQFKTDILEELKTRFDSDPGRILEWYTERKDESSAKEFVKRAVCDNGSGAELLHDSSRQLFKTEILEELKTRFDSDPGRILEWYTERKDESSAKEFVIENIERCTSVQLLSEPIFGWTARGQTFQDLLQSRRLVMTAVSICLTTERWNLDLASKWSSLAIKDTSRPAWREALRLWEHHLDDRRVRDWMSRGRNNPTAIQLLLLLVADGTATLEQHGDACRRELGENLHSILEGVNRNDLRFVDRPEPQRSRRARYRPAPPGPSFQVGDVVEFQHLSKADLNGKRGRVARNLAVEFRTKGRIPVNILPSSRMVSVAPQNIRKVDDTSVDSIPPLDTRYQSGLDVSSSENESTASDAPPPLRPGAGAARHNDDHGSEASSSSDDAMPNLTPRRLVHDSDETTDEENENNNRRALRARHDSSDSSEDGDVAVWRQQGRRRR